MHDSLHIQLQHISSKLSALCFAAMCLPLTLFLAVVSHAQQAELPRTMIKIGTHALSAEVAKKNSELATGMMFRRSMKDSEAMLFIFPEKQRACMWMKNTLIDLNVAFIEDDGKIVNIESMQAQKLDEHCSLKPVRFAIETNKGWFEKRNIKPGEVFKGEAFSAEKVY